MACQRRRVSLILAPTVSPEQVRFTSEHGSIILPSNLESWDSGCELLDLVTA